jgi:hypothetical protein
LALQKSFISDPVRNLFGLVIPVQDPEIYVKIGPRVPDSGQTPPDTILVSGAGEVKLSSNPVVAYFQHQPRLVQMALGLDFLEVSLLGKVFRILQLLSQFFIVAGAVYLLFKHRKYHFSAEFLAGVGCAFILLLVCITVEQFSAILNMTRFYHLSLLFLSPCLVIGFDFLFGRQK